MCFHDEIIWLGLFWSCLPRRIWQILSFWIYYTGAWPRFWQDWLQNELSAVGQQQLRDGPIAKFNRPLRQGFFEMCYTFLCIPFPPYYFFSNKYKVAFQLSAKDGPKRRESGKTWPGFKKKKQVSWSSCRMFWVFLVSPPSPDHLEFPIFKEGLHSKGYGEVLQ